MSTDLLNCHSLLNLGELGSMSCIGLLHHQTVVLADLLGHSCILLLGSLDDSSGKQAFNANNLELCLELLALLLGQLVQLLPLFLQLLELLCSLRG
jgi:hypothetical protein